jgi:hypothetical protein
MKQLFKIAKKPATRDEWLVSPGAVTIGDDFLNIGHYPFEPSAAFGQITLHASQMDDLDVTSAPPTIRMGNELIFLTAEKRSELRDFASRNNVTTVERPMIWEWPSPYRPGYKCYCPFLTTKSLSRSTPSVRRAGR